MIDNAKMVSMVNDAIETAEKHEGEAKGVPVTYHRPDPAKVEAIMAKLLADYPPLGDGDQVFVERIFNETGWLDGFKGETLDTLPQGVVPVLVFRHMLAVNRCTFNPDHTPSWNAFVDRYQQAILDA